MAPDHELSAHDSRARRGGDRRLAQPWMVGMAVVAIAQLMVVLDGTVVTIALPSAQLDLARQPRKGHTP